MKTRTPRQRQALYAGIADMPLPDIDQVVERFEYGYRRKPHMATLGLIYDIQRHIARPARRPLPGVPTAA